MNIRLQFLILLLSGLVFLSCDRDDLLNPADYVTQRVAPLDINYTTPPISNLDNNGRRYRFAEDIPYSSEHRRNTFDIFTLNSRKPTPLVVFIHSGGFSGGDKGQAYEFSPEIRKFIVAGIAFATVNYRFLEDSDNGVMTSLHDIKRAVQFFRFHAKEFNIDPNRISCFGVSAGAGAALWLATHDDMSDLRSNDPIARQSTRIRSAVALGTQSTYDLVKWEEIFKPYGFKLDSPVNDEDALFEFYGISSMEELYGERMVNYRKEVDMLGLFSPNDAPVYVYNTGGATPPTNDGELYHHPFHALAVKDAATIMGVENQIYAPGMNVADPSSETPAEFTIRHLKQ